MKKIIFLFCLVIITAQAEAKKVKFAVDMTGLDINATGVHIMGDFQDEAGYADGDWIPNTVSMLQEESSSVYSVVVDIPAFRLYQYRFLNGDQSYDTEFIPIPSRVGYDFNDNRWLYVDSLANDTTFVGAIMFSGNAPQGLNLMRFLVDMSQESGVDANGVHVAGTFQDWNPETTIMYSFVEGIYEIIAYDSPGMIHYKFINGNSNDGMETVSGDCTMSNERMIMLASDSVLNVVCFGSCAACNTINVDEINRTSLEIYPNPIDDNSIVQLHSTAPSNITIIDAMGRIVRSIQNNTNSRISLSHADYTSGVYTIQVVQNNQSYSSRFVVN